MKYKTLVSVSCVVLLLSGFVVLAVPFWLLNLYDAALTAGGAVLARSFGATYLALAVLAWAGRDAQELVIRKTVSVSLAICFGLGFVIFAVSQWMGVFNILGWLDIILNGSLTAGHIYFLSHPDKI
ncbi:MAG: hypothetical protein R6U57_12130 [Anaerolineales bacterium]